MNWSAIEEQWQSRHLGDLVPHLTLANTTHDLVESVATHPEILNGSRSEGTFAEHLLMRRLGEEFRSVEVLGAGGHGFQAIAAVCNLFEQAHMVGHVVGDEQRAKTWLEWKDRHKSAFSVKATVDGNAKKFGWGASEATASSEATAYQTYTFLCGFKHNSSLTARLLKLPGDADLLLAQLAIADGARFALSAAGVVAIVRLSGGEMSRILETANTLLDQAASLAPRFDSTLH